VSEVEAEFLLISEAVARLEAGMFGGAIRQPEAVKAAKKSNPRASIGLGLHKEKAASVVHEAILKGDLLVHVVTPPTAMETRRPIVVPVDVLQRMPKVRGGLPDHPVRHPVSFLRHHPIASDLFTALSTSALHLQWIEFDAWYKKQKSRRRWPSQTSQAMSKKPLRNWKRPSGRPTKQTNELLTSIRARVAEKKWSAPDGIAKLVRLLATHGAPNRNLVRRAVQRLYEETGANEYRIIPRKRVKPKTGRSQT
jgi:hypothetical protein